MIRLFFLLLAVAFFLTVLRGLRIFFRAVFQRPEAPGSAGGVRQAEMVRDPVCGRWIDRGLATLVRRGGETVPVCSPECGAALAKLEAR
jgi:hypothetical protein